MIRFGVFICFLCISCFCLADISKEDKQKIKSVLTGMDDSLLRLNSGVCRITGRCKLNTLEVIEADILIAFDYNRKLYRFDHEDNRSIRTPDYYYEYYKSGGFVTRSARDTPCSFEIGGLDIRNLGLCTRLGQHNKEEYVNVREKIFTDPPISIKESRGVFEVTVERTGTLDGITYPPIYRRYWIDSNKGFSMIRFEYYESKDTMGNALETVEMTWEEKENTWVPTSFKLTSVQSEHYWANWKLDWSLVNKEVPENYFDPSLLSDKPTDLFSLELEDPINVGKIGPGREIPGPLVMPTKREYSLLNYIFMGLGISMIVLGLGKRAYDWQRSRK